CGSIIGSGFLLKTAVAIVAGAVATAVGGDHAKRPPLTAGGGITFAAPGNEQSLRLVSARTRPLSTTQVRSQVAAAAQRGPVPTVPAGRFVEPEAAAPP